MASDNVLSFDAITAEGKYVTANAKENPDLFWALKGGGPSSFAVVTSVTNGWNDSQHQLNSH
jgi:FAD/FMN-containing dehydrogenase